MAGATVVVIWTLISAGLALTLARLALRSGGQLSAAPVANIIVVYLGTAMLVLVSFVAAVVISGEVGVYLIPAVWFTTISMLELVFIINVGRAVHVSRKRDRARAGLRRSLPELERALERPDVRGLRRALIKLQIVVLRLLLRM